MTRKIIYECFWGSHLFGTNTPESDEDYMGVFIPSMEDFYGLKDYNDEWVLSKKISTGERNTKGDVDRKMYSVRKFFNMAGKGDSMNIEMFFVPHNLVVQKTPEWDLIQENKHLFLSRKGVLPFIEFAKSQARKAIIKGEHLNRLRDIVRSLKEVAGKTEASRYFKGETLAMQPDGKEIGQVGFFGHILKYFRNSHGFLQFEIAGRPFDPGIKVKMLRKALEHHIDEYGERVKTAAEHGIDPKSLLHCMRQLSEAEEYLTTGALTFPRPDVPFLKTVLSREYPPAGTDMFQVIDQKIEYLNREVLPKSPLPEDADWKGIQALALKVYGVNCK